MSIHFGVVPGLAELKAAKDDVKAAMSHEREAMNAYRKLHPTNFDWYVKPQPRPVAPTVVDAVAPVVETAVEPVSTESA